jgi:hypothetical protein
MVGHEVETSVRYNSVWQNTLETRFTIPRTKRLLTAEQKPQPRAPVKRVLRNILLFCARDVNAHSRRIAVKTNILLYTPTYNMYM